ncbi:hypothetical protein FHG87_019554 [Trinorchestia longiramus]|nr:hypothetical protein FHG87_019554 [Trinorchestia longiramus]
MSDIKKKTKPSQGPFGYGDPDDLSLRKVETEILIPKKMREIAHKEKCTQEVSDIKKKTKPSQGPFGYGDPDDLSLRKVETEILILKKMREIAHKEKCTQEVSGKTDMNIFCIKLNT